MIYNPADLRSLASAVNKFWKKEFNETPIQEAPVTMEDVLELSESVDNWLRKSGRPFTAYSNFEENDNDIEPAVVLCYSKGGSELTKWGRENCRYLQYPEPQLSLTETWADGSKYEVIWKLWADEEFLRKAKEAFNQLGEDPVMKEAKIVPETVQAEHLEPFR